MYPVCLIRIVRVCAREITRSEVFLVMKGNVEFDYACEPASKPEFERETESETAQPVCRRVARACAPRRSS